MSEPKKANPRKRAATAPDNEIGQERYELYKASFSWTKKAIDDGYYLEAISIVESLIADRLESYLSSLKGEDFSFKTLGSSIDAIRSKENKTDESLHALVTEKLDHWRKRRNIAAHEMVKIEEGKKVSWEERVKINQEVAQDGLELVRKIDIQVRKARPSHSLPNSSQATDLQD